MRRDVWQQTVGRPPVTVLERAAKGHTLYLRWYDADAPAGERKGTYRWESLGRVLRTASGHIMAEVQTWALEQAMRRSQVLAGVVVNPTPIAPDALTLQQGLSLATDPETGKYPITAGESLTNHQREVVRSLQFAMAVWGAGRAWAKLGADDLRQLWRRRIRELAKAGQRGHRGAETTIARVLAVAQWLRDQGKIPPLACLPPKRWRQELVEDWRTIRKEPHDPEPRRPRYTLDESRKHFEASRAVDPRYELLVALGAEYRLGQVARQRRSHLDLTAGTFTIKGRGKKRGTIVKLTAGQRAVAERALTTGYLRELEAQYHRDGTDYPLWPSGRLRGYRAEGGTVVERTQEGQRRRTGFRMVAGEDLVAPREAAARPPLTPTPIQDWFRETERRAGIVHLEGRGWYAIRRASIDYLKRTKASPEAQLESGGWSDSRMPDTIYADPEKEYARDEARDARADFRGETSAA